VHRTGFKPEFLQSTFSICVCVSQSVVTSPLFGKAVIPRGPVTAATRLDKPPPGI